MHHIPDPHAALAELALGCEPPPPLAAYGRDAPIVSIGSLSKLFWAGLRVGWIMGEQPLIDAVTRMRFDMGVSP